MASDRKHCRLVGGRKIMSFTERPYPQFAIKWPSFRQIFTLREHLPNSQTRLCPGKKPVKIQISNCKRGKKDQPVFFFHFHGNSMSFPIRFDVIDVSSPSVPGPQFAAPVRHGTCLANLDPLRDNHWIPGWKIPLDKLKHSNNKTFRVSFLNDI